MVRTIFADVAGVARFDPGRTDRTARRGVALVGHDRGRTNDAREFRIDRMIGRRSPVPPISFAFTSPLKSIARPVTNWPELSLAQCADFCYVLVMNDFDKDQVLQWYGWLEDELLEILKYIPPSEQNLETFSPRLASLIIETCGLLDSVLRQVSDEVSIIDGKRVPRRNLDIRHYSKLYANRYQLPPAKSILLITPARYIAPFEEWNIVTEVGDYNPLGWWQIHTKLKHDRIANLRKAKLNVAIDSLCALHLIVGTLKEFARAVLARGWITGRKWSPELTIETLEGGGFGSLLVESKLFVIARGEEKFPERIEDFHPGLFNASERVIDFFGRSY
jgi:hypothetical protein